MREKGLEPSRPEAPDPKSGVSAIPPLSQKSSLIQEGPSPQKCQGRETPESISQKVRSFGLAETSTRNVKCLESISWKLRSFGPAETSP